MIQHVMIAGNGVRNICHTMSVILGVIKKSFGSGVLQSSQTQEWPAFENILLRRVMLRYGDLRRPPVATPSLITADAVNFLNKEKIFSASGAKCILFLNGLLVNYNIVVFHLH